MGSGTTQKAIMNASAPRVCILSYCAALGGIANYQALQIEYLAEKVPVLFLGESPRSTFKGVRRELWSRVQVATLPVWTRPFAALRSVWRVLRSWRPSVVAISNIGLMILWAPLLRMLRLMTGCEIVHVYHSRRTTPSLQGYVLELLASVAHVNASAVVYVSEYTKSAWQSAYPWMRLVPGRVVPNGVPLENVPVRSGRERLRTLGFVGRLEDEKGARLFCEVARHLREMGYDFQFEVFGEGSERAALESEFGSIVHFHGIEFNKNAIWKNLDALVVTSRIENAPYAVLEAKARGIPVVTVPIGGIPEIVEDGDDGIFCGARTVDAYTEAVLKAVTALPRLREGCLVNRNRYDSTTLASIMWGPYLHDKELRVV